MARCARHRRIGIQGHGLGLHQPGRDQQRTNRRECRDEGRLDHVPSRSARASAQKGSGSRMTNINKGIINTGSIGGNASVTVTDYGSGNVIAPGSVVDIRQRAQKVERELQAEGGPDATELAAVKAALVQLTRQTAEAADARAGESTQLLAAIEALAGELNTKGAKSAAAPGLMARVIDAASKLADTVPAAVKLAAQIG